MSRCSIRIRALNSKPIRSDGDYVLYWMIAQRRLRHNFALQRAVQWARDLSRPLLILEALRCDYPWASDRLHRFVVDGMIDNIRALATSPALYYPYLEPSRGAGKGLLEALAARAAVVVTDDYPAFFLPRMAAAAAARLAVKVEAIDGNGLLPLRASDRIFTTAYSFRRTLQKHLLNHLDPAPLPDPLNHLPQVPAAEPEAGIIRRWPRLNAGDLLRAAGDLGAFPIDHGVPPGAVPGGAAAAERRLQQFIAEQLERYGSDRNHPDRDGASGLSPYLHFGHIAAHQVFSAITEHQGWSPAAVSFKADGRRQGWWGMSESAEAFLDQLITWREVGFNRCARQVDYDRFESLPAWAQDTLHQHRRDPRPHRYRLDEFAQAGTHDPPWNAAQTQLVRDGTIHNYLRMLWGKKILYWSPSPEEALEIMLELNNKYALDGRDPNSTSGSFWILGRYDRAWGPERPIFGKVRFMSSKNTAAKVRLQRYMQQYAAD